MANHKYTKEFLEPIIKESRFWSEVFEKLNLIDGGNNRSNITNKIKKYNIDISHFKSKKDALGIKALERGYTLTPEQLFVTDCKHDRRSVKNMLFSLNLKEHKCELCGQGEEWNGKKMSLILDHKNGINNDNRLENLQIVCPNCNATLDTHCRGIKRIRKTLPSSNGRI